MWQSHAETILTQLHDQYRRGIGCDVILRASDHLKQKDPQTSNSGSSGDHCLVSLHCHQNVLRAASSFFDQLFSNEFTVEKSELQEGIDGMLVVKDSASQNVLQLVFHEISSHTIQALVDFAYTGSVKVGITVLKKVVEDLKFLNMQSMINELSSRLEEDLICSNCIHILIVSSLLRKEETYKKVLFFILNEFSRGIQRGTSFETSWRSIFELEVSAGETSSRIITMLKTEAEESEKLGLTEDIYLLKILINIIETNSVSQDEEFKLHTFLLSKRREKCANHFQSVVLYCYTDNKQLCVECLADSHAQHHIEPIDKAMCKKMAPFWQRVDMEFENVKESSKERLAELEDFTKLICLEKSRDFAILDACAEIKPKMDTLSNAFKTGRINPKDVDILVLHKFVAALKKDSKRVKEDYEKAKTFSAKLMSLIYKRSATCASITNTVSELLIEELQEIDIYQLLTTSNCISFLKAAENAEDQDIYGKCFDFLLKNFVDVINKCGESFHRRISATVLEELLRSNLRVGSEDDVVLVVKKWLHFDMRRRKKFAPQLLKHIRFGRVSKEVLEKFRNDSSYLMMLNVNTMKLVQDASVDQRPGGSTVETKMLVFGVDYNFLYDSEKEIWEKLKGNDCGIGFCAVRVGETVFILGGTNYSDKSLARVLIYNLRSKTWRKGPSMLQARSYFGACVSSENTIHVIGGFYDSMSILSSVEMLKCTENGEPLGSWQLLPSISSARYGLEAAVIDDKVYTIGGCPYGFRHFNNWKLDRVEEFDLRLNVWKECKSMSEARKDHAVCTYNGDIYVFGSNGKCEKYNPVTDSWTAIAACPKSTCGRGSAVLNNKIYLMGGYRCKATDIYDPQTNTWSKGPQLPVDDIGYTRCVAWK